ARLPFSSGLPSPTASTLPCLGFSLAVSGRMIPPAVLSSASSRSTTILSFSGTTFIADLRGGISGLGGLGLSRRVPVDLPQRPGQGVQHDVLVHRLGDHTIDVRLERLPQQLPGRV